MPDEVFGVQTKFAINELDELIGKDELDRNFTIEGVSDENRGVY